MKKKSEKRKKVRIEDKAPRTSPKGGLFGDANGDGDVNMLNNKNPDLLKVRRS